MNLEERFNELLVRSNNEFIMYLPSTTYSFLKVDYRPYWKDGLGNLSLIRIINPKVGLSTAPRNWDHLVQIPEPRHVTLE